jgi:DNA-binding NarL/FixJ family response regulator
LDKLRILLVDDHVVVREGLKALINAQADMEVIGESGDGRSAVALAQDLRPDVAIVDVSMPEVGGAQATEQLRQVCPATKVLALTVHEDKGYLRLLLEAGASGYALKRAPAEELIHAVRTVASGGVYLDPFLASRVVGSLVRRPSSRGETLRVEPLSDRENEVVLLLARGYSIKEIAAQLSIGVKTVETYKARSLEKLGLRSRADLVRYAIQRGWLTEP